jgi:hypothetical protein
MAAKIDNAALQDGYSLYHHVIFFDEQGNWAIVQQGMNSKNKMARRYHWISENLKSFVIEPHAGIISENKNPNTLNMTSIESKENQKICVDMVNGDINNLQSSVYKVLEIIKKNNTSNKINTLDNWIVPQNNNIKITIDSTLETQNEFKFNNKIYAKSNSLSEHYEMPRRLDWNVFRKAYDIQPKNYEQLISIPGIGPSSVRALSLIGEIIFGISASWQDPVKYNFAHGGKDGVPYPVARKTYDKSISYLYSALEGAEIQREERIETLKKLAEFSNRMFNQKK